MLARVPALPCGWEVRLAAAERLPLPAGEVDVAIVSYLLHLLPRGDRDRVLGELRRVLRLDGRLVTVTPYLPPSAVWGLAARAAAATARVAPAALGGLSPHDPRPELRAGRLEPVRARTTRRGYPSLIVLARPTRMRGKVL